MNGVGELMPARLASATIGGRDSSISVIARSTDASSETSAPTPIAFTARLEPISAAAAFASSVSFAPDLMRSWTVFSCSPLTAEVSGV